MKDFFKRYYAYLILIGFSIPLFFISVEDLQSWGDDYAQYIKEGQNIAEGKPYHQSNYVYNDLNADYAPPSYPPGFPLLLAPVIKIYGLAIRPMLYTISLLMVVLLFSVFMFFKKYTPIVSALCLAILTVYSPAVMDMKGYVLSDIPLLVFVSLYLLLRQTENSSYFKISLITFIALMAVFIRSQAIVLLLAEVLLILFKILKSIKSKTFTLKLIYKSDGFKILLSFAFFYLIATNTFFFSPDNSWNFYSSLFGLYKGEMWTIVGQNCIYLFELLRSILNYENNTPYLQTLVLFIEYISLGFFIIGLIFYSKKIDSLSLLFFLLMCFMIILLPVRQGLRYLLPVVPLYLLFVYYGAALLIKKIKFVNGKLAALVFSLIYLFLGLDNFQRKPYDPNWTPYTKEDSLAFKYMRENISDQDLIVFAKPRALTLYTNLKTVNIAWKETTEKNKIQFAKLKVKYMLVRDGLDENFVGRYLNETKSAIDSLKIGSLYCLYTVKN